MIRGAARAALLAALLAGSGAPALAHGTGWRLSGERTVAVELYYADGEAMPFADVKLFRPDDAATPALHGRSDERGRFAFVPDRDGTWTLVAADGDGHGIRAPIPVSLAAAAPGEAPAAPGRAPLELRLGLLVSILLNVALFLLAWKLWPRRTPLRA